VCPVCIGTIALVLAKSAAGGGLAAVVTTKLRAKSGAEIAAVPKSQSRYMNEKENSL